LLSSEALLIRIGSAFFMLIDLFPFSPMPLNRHSSLFGEFIARGSAGSRFARKSGPHSID
jgi:hypothetical protein